VTAEEVLWDIKVADAANLYKFYLNQEKKILGVVAVMLFLTLWEFMGGALSAYNPIPFLRINPMFMSAPSLIWKAALQLFSSGEIYNDLYVSGSATLAEATPITTIDQNRSAPLRNNAFQAACSNAAPKTIKTTPVVIGIAIEKVGP